MGKFDWRDRPKASPWGGFFIQSRAGRNRNNFEVVIPWPDGGLAHFYRDNDDAAALQWYGPTLFAQGAHYQGVSITESDFRSYSGTPAKNLEVVAVRQDGVLEHWWRENGGALTWRLGSVIAERCKGVPAIAYSGALFDPIYRDIPFIPDAFHDSHEPASFHVVAAAEGGGFNYFLKSTDAGSAWTRVPGFPGTLKPEDYAHGQVPSGPLVGMAIALTAIGANSTYTTYKDVWEDDSCASAGNTFIIGTSEDNELQIYRSTFPRFRSPDTGIACEWVAAGTVTKPSPEIQAEEFAAFYGRPSIIQGDYNQDDPGLFDQGNYGNLEIVAPLKNGGLIHRARNNGNPYDGPDHINKGWGPGTQFGGIYLYDEVSLIQSNYGPEDHGNLELVARNRCQFGFDFFWRHNNVWHGPIYFGRESGTIRLGTSRDPLSVITGPLSPADKLTALGSVNILTSIEPVSEMVAWLGDPDTPYPALADALLTLMVGRRLAAPVYVDVIRYFYEDRLGQSSPRSVSDVRVHTLQEAVVGASNENNGTAFVNFEELIAP